MGARFSNDESARVAYSRIRNLIFKEAGYELSVYRLLISGMPHVVVIGHRPKDERSRIALERCLGQGTVVALGVDLIRWLGQRRSSERARGTWVEQHHRPGLIVQLTTEARPLFRLGRLVMTKALERRLHESDPENWESQLMGLIARHARGDWGNLDDHDRSANEAALAEGGRLLSAYKTAGGIDVWVITEADRSYTTALLPDDY